MASGQEWPVGKISPLGPRYHRTGSGDWHEHQEAGHEHKGGASVHLHRDFPAGVSLRMMTEEDVVVIQEDARRFLGVELTPEDIDPALRAIADAKDQLGLEIRPWDIREES